MPHPILITTAVTASALATALAVEHFVFRPWREDNWPEGFVPGMKREWDGFKRDFKQGFHEIAGGREDWQGQHYRRQSDVSLASSAPGSADESAWGSSREAAMHEQEMQLVRRRHAQELNLMDDVAGQQAPSSRDQSLDRQGQSPEIIRAGEQHIIGTPPLSPLKRQQTFAEVTRDPTGAHPDAETQLNKNLPNRNASEADASTSPFELVGMPVTSGPASLIGSSHDDEWERLSNSSTEGGSVVSVTSRS